MGTGNRGTMNAKKIMAVFIILALVIIVVAIIFAFNQPQNGAGGEYNYSVKYSDTFQDAEGYTVEAQAGRTFAIAEIILKNNSVDGGIQTKAVVLHWKYTIDKVTYGLNELYTLKHPDYWDVKVEKGRSFTYTVVFEISKDAVGKRDASLSYDYLASGGLSLKYNSSLTPGNVSSFEPFADLRKIECL